MKGTKMITVYKLTTQDNKTRKGEYNECTWGENVTHSGTGQGELCGNGYIHAYTSPELAVLLNPIHANIKKPKLWVCSVDSIDKNDKGLKVGSISLTTIKEIPLPVFTDKQKTVFAILCAKKALELVDCKNDKNITVWHIWADKFLSGAVTTLEDAHNAAYAAYAAKYAAAAYAVAAVYPDADADAAYAAAYAANINLIEIAIQAINWP
jgi:hypothetical protein